MPTRIRTVSAFVPKSSTVRAPAFRAPEGATSNSAWRYTRAGKPPWPLEKTSTPRRARPSQTQEPSLPLWTPNCTACASSRSKANEKIALRSPGATATVTS